MAGTLEISDELCWMPAGWVFDNVLGRLAEGLREDWPAVSGALLSARTDERGGYIDLRALRPEELLAMRHAADAAYTDLESAGASSFSAPEFYEGFMAQFRELKELLHARSDPVSRRPGSRGDRC